MGFLPLLFAIILMLLLGERIKNGSRITNKRIFNRFILVIFILFIVSLIGYGITHSRDVKRQEMVASASQKASIAASQKAAASSSSYKQLVNSKKGFVKYSGDDDGYGITANKDNIVNTKLTLSQPAKVSYKIDDPSEAKVISFTKTSDTTYSLSIQMLKSSKDDYGAYLYIYTNRDGYKVSKRISIYNYASLHGDSKDKSSSTNESKKNTSNTKSKKSADSKVKAKTKAKAKADKFAASIYNLPKSTNGVISKVQYKKNLIDDLYIVLTISDATLDNIYDKELKRLCFNMYRKVKGDAKKAGLKLSDLTIDDEQDDILANYEIFGAFRYYGMGADVVN